MRLLFLACASLAAADPLPPQVVPARAQVEARPDEDGRKVWHTRSFRIDSDLDLRSSDLSRLAQVADTTALAVKAHPLPLFAPPQGVRPRIAIYSEDQAYQEAGGMPGSSGYYTARNGLVLIHGGHFSRPPGATASRLGPAYDEDLVVHEIVHLCMHRVNRALPSWLAEGIAEYFACAHAGAGRFSFAGIDSEVSKHLRIRLSHDKPVIPLVPVAEVTDPGTRWDAYVTSLPVDERYRAYATSLLLAHRILHGGQEQVAALREALTAAPRARRLPRLIEDPTATQEALVRYWKTKGLTLEFPPATR